MDREQPWMSQAREELTSQCVQHCPMMVCCYTNHSLAPTIQRGSFFLDDLHYQLVPAEERRARNSPTFVVVWDNVALNDSAAVTDGFAAHPRMLVLFLSPYSPFLNPKIEFSSAWRWKVYDHHTHDQMSLLDTMNAGCGDSSPEDCQG